MGKEFTLGEFTCVPVIRLGMGFGYGGGEGGGDTPELKGHGEGSGAGAGMGIEPVGFLAARGGEITFIPAHNTKGLSAAFEKLPDKTVEYIINELYNSPYVFTYIPVEILGNAYERFLGKTITVNARHQVIIEEKPDVRKAGGVFLYPSVYRQLYGSKYHWATCFWQNT